MMAEQKYFEVQRLIEVQLTLKSDNRHELLSLYFDSLQAQQKKIPTLLLLELAEFESESHHHELVLQHLAEINTDLSQKYFIRIQKLIIAAAVDKGQMDQLYTLLNAFLIYLFEKQIPLVPDWITDKIEKYFKNDFILKLKELALSLLLNNVSKAEVITRDLITSCIEKSSPKGRASKLLSIGEILRCGENKAQLEIYQNFCFISAGGTSEKSDYKKIVEMVIYFDDFKFQVLILNLMHQLKLKDSAIEYSRAIRLNASYDFVYFDKYFNHLKSYFVQPAPKNKTITSEIMIPDLKLSEKFLSEIMSPVLDVEEYEDEQRYFNLIKYQSYTTSQLCDLAVSFLQSEMPRVALKASKQAIKQSENDKDYLKGSYLKLTCLLLLKDFRSALDTCFEAISRATTKDDVLSFLYGQAEIYIRLNQTKDARKILSKILSIDSKYRLAKERLDKLNEI
jgi:tetratricopeptide (TPR) repeat protein